MHKVKKNSIDRNDTSTDLLQLESKSKKLVMGT